MLRHVHPLLFHLTLIVIVKIGLLVLLWWLFFREPPMQITPQKAADRISGSHVTSGVAK